MSARMALALLEHEIIRLEIKLADAKKRLAAIVEKDQQIAALKLEVAKLCEQLGQNSRNSSRPPSSDPLNERAQRKSKAQPSSRNRGGQDTLATDVNSNRHQQLMPHLIADLSVVSNVATCC